MSKGPLCGVKIVEFAGLGPGPFGAMLLADLGATVLRIERAGGSDLGVKRPIEYDYVLRNRTRVTLDLKSPDDLALARQLLGGSDVLIEGFRPGVMERLMLGPDTCLDLNPTLVYARITGWGQSGPNAAMAGHDLNYIAITGALALMGREGSMPTPPLNAVGDFAGGGMMLAIGILSALHEARQSGRGQVVDTSVVDGTLSLISQFFGMYDAGIWSLERGTNVLDSGAPFYDTYRCKDGELIALAAIEDKFFAQFLERAGLSTDLLEWKRSRGSWPKLREAISHQIADKTRDEWMAIFTDCDACVSPVLNLDEARRYPPLTDRSAFVEVDGHLQPAPAPRFSRTPSQKPSAAANISKDELLAWWGTQTSYATAKI